MGAHFSHCDKENMRRMDMVTTKDQLFKSNIGEVFNVMEATNTLTTIIKKGRFNSAP